MWTEKYFITDIAVTHESPGRIVVVSAGAFTVDSFTQSDWFRYSDSIIGMF